MRKRTRVWMAVAALLLGAAPLTGCTNPYRPGPPVPSVGGAQTPNQPAARPSASASAGSPASSAQARAVPGSATLHYIANTGADTASVARLGYNLFDTGSDPQTVAALPAGGRSLVWLGPLDSEDCASPGYGWSQFTAAVDRLAGNPRVYGYYLSDEPHPRVCPSAVADIRQRADYIRAHDPTHRSFILVVDGTNQCGGSYGCEYDALRPGNTHVDLVGLDPYPCNVTSSGCVLTKIDDAVHRAEAHGIPQSAVVPVFQAFGQSCASSNYYRLPSAPDLRGILAHWAAVVSKPSFDYTYTWGHQHSSCPTLVDSADLQAVMQVHNQS